MRRVLRLKEVKEATGLSRSSIYALQQRGIFPQSIRVGPKATGWYEDEVQNYIETRPRTGETGPGRDADRRRRLHAQPVVCHRLSAAQGTGG